MVGNLKVLLTDEKDNATIQLVNALRANKMDVTLCQKNGAELLSLIEETNPDVVVMDAFLQHIDAVDVVSRINMKNPVKRPLLIVMSGIDNVNFEREILKSGVDYYFLKPIDASMVAQRIIQLTSWKDVGVTAKYEPPQDNN